MGDKYSAASPPEPGHWAAERDADAFALSERLGPGMLAWLDDFLADYVFVGEPLDRVLVKARELSHLPRRQPEHGEWLDD